MRSHPVTKRRHPWSAVELMLRHTNSSIMAQGCDLEVPFVGDHPSTSPRQKASAKPD
jgi:hypothetical protein